MHPKSEDRSVILEVIFSLVIKSCGQRWPTWSLYVALRGATRETVLLPQETERSTMMKSLPAVWRLNLYSGHVGGSDLRA